MPGLGGAWVRAGESERPDRLFDDPLAARFLAASGWEPRPLGELSGDETTTRAMLVLAQSVIVRTRFLDDVLADAWSGGCRQVVILGAGLDTRAFRLAWPAGSRCFDLDLPAVLDFKGRALAGRGSGPACQRLLRPADPLRDRATPPLPPGFHARRPTARIAEG